MSGDSGDPRSLSGAVVAGGPVDAAVDSFIGALQQFNVNSTAGSHRRSRTRRATASRGKRRTRSRRFRACCVTPVMATPRGRLTQLGSAALAGDDDDVPPHVLLERLHI